MPARCFTDEPDAAPTSAADICRHAASRQLKESQTRPYAASREARVKDAVLPRDTFADARAAAARRADERSVIADCPSAR